MKNRSNPPKFTVIYSDNVEPEVLCAERYIEFIKHLVNVVKEQEAMQIELD